MTIAHRYEDITADEAGAYFDLCKPCAKVLDAEDVIDLRGPILSPDVDYEEGYTCDRCDRRIALVNIY